MYFGFLAKKNKTKLYQTDLMFFVLYCILIKNMNKYYEYLVIFLRISDILYTQIEYRRIMNFSHYISQLKGNNSNHY